MKRRPHISEQIKRHWFLIGILTCILLAAIHPHLGSRNGPFKTEYSVKYGAVSIIFLISGLSLKTESFLYTLRQYKLHIFIQGFTFILIPFVVQVLVKLLDHFAVNSWVLKGLVTVACMPPSVSSAVILTTAAQGNEAAAIFNSVLGTFLAIIITPMFLLIHLGFTTLVPLLRTMFQLAITVILPILFGQILRKYTSFKSHDLPLNTTGQCALLYIIYTTLCDSFLIHDVGLSAPDILVSVFLVVVLQVLFLSVSFCLAVNMEKYFTAADIVTIIFCSTHKSLTLGIPILRVMFHGFSHLSQISLPLLVYHPTQIILGGMIISSLKDWMRTQRNKKLPV